MEGVPFPHLRIDPSPVHFQYPKKKNYRPIGLKWRSSKVFIGITACVAAFTVRCLTLLSHGED